jgi:hypothetical protein
MSIETPNDLENESVHIIGHERKNINFGVLMKAFERIRSEGNEIVVNEDESTISLAINEKFIVAEIDGDKVKIGIIGNGGFDRKNLIEQVSSLDMVEENNNQITGIGTDVSKFLITSRDEFVDMQKEEIFLQGGKKRQYNKFVFKKPNTKGFKNY